MSRGPRRSRVMIYKEGELPAEMVRLAKERTKPLCGHWTSIDAALSDLAAACYLQGFHDLCAAEQNLKAQAELLRLTGPEYVI